jgi:hypothetical protein
MLLTGDPPIYKRWATHPMIANNPYFLYGPMRLIFACVKQAQMEEALLSRDQLYGQQKSWMKKSIGDDILPPEVKRTYRISHAILSSYRGLKSSHQGIELKLTNLLWIFSHYQEGMLGV